ncbi:hypothetical protein [Brachybacterium kimchii]|uniref:Uncharacterized protein n=1 Tax=Brachybacterium kimchii TaxID=2942909 RepID=A0ABY4N342_9MICO|nr:hypothetical protein [Brachybacterium kimchii]UQN28177.1 hypothetical protein M4486_10990 [Brachybacterium kimchii]
MTAAPTPPADVPQFSARDVEIATELLEQPLDEPVVEIVTLTDEELMALDGVQHDPLTPTPWVSGSAEDPEARRLVAAAAMRSLIARGVVSSTAVLDPRRYEDGSTEAARMVAVPALHGTVVLRRTADAVLVAERRTDRGTAFAYFYLFHLESGEVRVLWEAFDDGGFHLFFLLDGKTLPEQFIAFIDPVDGISDDDGDVEEVPAADFGTSTVAQGLAEARAATTTLILARGVDAAPTAFTLFSMPDRVVLMESDGDDHDAVQRLGTVSRASLENILGELVAATAPDASDADADADAESESEAEAENA